MTIQDLITKLFKEPKMAESESVEFTFTPQPEGKEVRNAEWVYYGKDNLYPQHLHEILKKSPTQGAIIKGKAGMQAGSDIILSGTANKTESDAKLLTLSPAEQAAYNSFIANDNGCESTQDISGKLALDWQKFGALALEVTWSMDFSRIVTLKHVRVDGIRCGKIINGRVQEYYYSRDWTNYKVAGYEPKKIAAFDQENKKDYNQLIYIKAGTQDYYGVPLFEECINWVDIEGQIAQFHNSNLSNGYAPSLAIKFYQMPGSPEEKKIIVDGIKKQYTGTNAAGRAMVFFSAGKELSPDVEPIQVSNLDKQYQVTAELAVQNILTANQITSPLLFGISVPGSLSNASELEIAYQILNRSSVAPDRNRLARLYNMILKINGGPVIDIMEFKPFELTQTKN